MVDVISEKGKLAPLRATKRWVIERTNSWSNAHKKLMWCTERKGQVIDFWIAFSNVVIIVGSSSEKPGVATAEREDLLADYNLLAQALR